MWILKNGKNYKNEEIFDNPLNLSANGAGNV